MKNRKFINYKQPKSIDFTANQYKSHLLKEMTKFGEMVVFEVGTYYMLIKPHLFSQIHKTGAYSSQCYLIICSV